MREGANPLRAPGGKSSEIGGNTSNFSDHREIAY